MKGLQNPPASWPPNIHAVFRGCEKVATVSGPNKSCFTEHSTFGGSIRLSVSLSLSLPLAAPDSSLSRLSRILSYKRAFGPPLRPVSLSCAALLHEPGVLQEHAGTQSTPRWKPRLSKLRSQCPTRRWRSTRPTKSKAMDSRDTKKSLQLQRAKSAVQSILNHPKSVPTITIASRR